MDTPPSVTSPGMYPCAVGCTFLHLCLCCPSSTYPTGLPWAPPLCAHLVWTPFQERDPAGMQSPHQMWGDEALPLSLLLISKSPRHINTPRLTLSTEWEDWTNGGSQPGLMKLGNCVGNFVLFPCFSGDNVQCFHHIRTIGIGNLRK